MDTVTTVNEPHRRRNNARKAAARRYQREHPGSTYAQAHAHTSPTKPSADSLARLLEAGFYQAALLSGSTAVVEASTRLLDAINSTPGDGPRLLEGASFGQWLSLKMTWLHTAGQLSSALFPAPLPASAMPSFDCDEPQFPEPLADTSGLEEAAVVLAQGVQIMEGRQAGNQHPETEPEGFADTVMQVRRIFEWVCPTSTAQLTAIRIANERAQEWLRQRRHALHERGSPPFPYRN